MTRYARANGSKSCNARVSADPTPWSEMVSPKTNKRNADSVDDDEVTTPKKEKKTPAKKTPKVVKLEPGTPKTPAVSNSPSRLTSPLTAPTSAKKAPRKTPLKPKDLANTPKNANTPQGKMCFIPTLVL